jgi:PST family polysaccharide transporter
MSRRRLIENILSLGSLQAASYVLPLLTLPYLARVLGPEDLGRIAFALAFSQIFVMFTEYGFNLSAAHEISVNRDNPQKVAEIFSSVTALRAGFMTIGFIVLLIMVFTIPKFEKDIPIYLISYMLVVGSVLFPQWLFQGLEQLKLVSILQIVARACAAAGIFLLVKSKDDLLWAVWLQSANIAFAGLLTIPSIVIALRGVRPPVPTRSALIYQLREGWHIFISSLAANSYTTSSVFILGMLLTPLAVGYYSVAEKLVRALLMMFGPIIQAIYPYISKMAHDDPARALAFNRKLLIGLGSLALLLAIALSLASGLLIRLLFGESFAPAIPVLATLAFTPLFIVLSNILGVQTMIPFGMKNLFSSVMVKAAFLNLLVFIPLALQFGPQGAASANVLVEAFVMIYLFMLLHWRGKNPMTFSLSLK